MKSPTQRSSYKIKYMLVSIILVLIVICVISFASSKWVAKRTKTAWLASYPESCPSSDLTVTYAPYLSLHAYLLKCKIYPDTMDYANPLVVVNARDCTAVLYLPNLSLPGEYLGKFASTTRMPVCP